MSKHESTAIDVPETSKESKGKAPLLWAAAAHARGGNKRGIAIFDLVFRISAFVAAITAAIIMGTAEQRLPFFTQFFQFHAQYDDLPTFKFYVVAMGVVTGYLLLSIPFSIVCIARPLALAPRFLLLILDTVVITLAASAAGASAAIVYLAHNGNNDANWLAICQQFNDFCQTTSLAVVAGFVTVVLMSFLVLLSAVALKRH